MAMADTEDGSGVGGGGADHAADASGGGAGPAGGGRTFGDITFGKVSGSAVGIGDHNHIVNGRQGEAPCDPAYQELLEAVRQLADDLRRVVPSPEVGALSDELDQTQDEIQRTGRAGAGRLARIRVMLQDASAGVGMLASGVAVGQAVGTLLGG
ncbi:hypothetical protein [Streptomyces violaceusniger]|uniref:Uncharacterized protein n=1 Tax=Streptomyces violaceusniger (strain Tu 4113) TaxID=653045 RepID=G2P1J5_STRV4|nr:hypothetical protein [Streptomyces violaceusniger]AEM87944.1 hypothetical protein Strvi_8640 [Streptomyces violaceusniger Tu 4113]